MALDEGTDLPDRTDLPESGPLRSAVLERATSAMRAEPPDRHFDITSTVKQRVHGLVSAGRELVVHAPDGAPTHDAAGSRVTVAERVLRAAVRRAVTGPDVAPDRLRVVVEEGTSPSGAPTQHVDLELDVVARYGTDLRRVGDELRADLLVLLDATLGPATRPRLVDVAVVDVTPDDPSEG
ncbi:hypothetical protein [Nocardioides alkalitolerans]|uniref:hypothetical protein n=1 Tax=Nocardioides alkalitolerans TaxID=281714 RepID=UPI0003FF3BA1|nr:hypothetical protein [Nocardioides alkalitolerans]